MSPLSYIIDVLAPFVAIAVFTAVLAFGAVAFGA